MTSNHIGRASCAVLFAATLLAAPAAGFAQTGSAPSAPAAPKATPAPAAAAQPDKRITARVEARIKDLHTKLRITAAEEPQWTAFTAVMRENAQHTEETLEGRGDPKTLSALDEMRGYTAMAATHAADMQKMLPVFEALYNSFAPEQQKLADTVFREQEGRRRR